MIDEILKLQVAGANPKQIMQILGLNKSAYYAYNLRLRSRIIHEQLAKRHEELLVDKQIVKDRLTKAMQIEDAIMTDKNVSPRTRMDAATRYSEISVAAFKLEAETVGFINALSTLREQKNDVIQLPTEIQDERDAVDVTLEEEQKDANV
jgi:ACT domain-containing protein